MSLERINGETDFEYHKRLIYGKLVDKTLSDCDYSEIAEIVYGQPYSSDVARRMMYGSCKTYQCMDRCVEDTLPSSVPESIMSEIEMQKIEIMKERQRLFDQRAAYKKVIRERSRQEELNSLIESAISNGSLTKFPSPVVVNDVDLVGQDDQVMLISMTDIHYGADISNHWNTYNSSILQYMLSSYLLNILRIKKDHNISRCIVWANGDLINGNIHQSVAVSNKENVVEQLIGVSEALSVFLYELSKEFSEVKFVSVSGNHSRIDTKDRALKDERLDDLVEWYLRARMVDIKNIVFTTASEKPDCTLYAIDVCGKTYVGVHGDYDYSPSKISSLSQMVGKDVYGVLTGHLHHNMIDSVNGVKVIMGGSFIGMDDYCISKRIYGKKEQLICICDKDGLVCSYDIKF